MKKDLVKYLSLCTFLVALMCTTGCGGGGGGGSDPGTTNSLTSKSVAGVGANYAQTGQQANGNTYETPEPATLSMLLSGIAGAGGYLVFRRRRRA